MAASALIERVTRPAQSAGYRPYVYTGSWLAAALDGRPRFSWLEVDRMRYDPQVQFGLRILRCPLWGATWKVQADKPQVQAWVDRELKHVYQRLLPRIVRFYEYGVAGGEVTFRARRSRLTGRTRVHFADFYEAHPRDLKPIVFERGGRAGRLAGLRVQNVAGATDVLIDRRHSFWFKGETEFGSWYGRPRLAGCYMPWYEKSARHGATDSRRLFYTKDAFRGPMIRHPLGMTDFGTEGNAVLISNADVARELVEKFVNGGVLTLPNTKDDKGDYLWTWEDPKGFSDIAGLLDYPKQLDREILIGLGIPPELVDAATVGSGYSGRAIPAQVFFSSMDEVIALIVEAIDRQIIRPLVRLNFGREGYTITPDSLAKAVQQAMPGAMGTPPPAPESGAGGGGPGGQPYVGPRGGHGLVDPKTGHVQYGADVQPHVRLSQRQWEGLNGDKTPRRKKKRKKRGACRVRMSWTAYQGPRGGRGWVSDTGEVRYQEHMPPEHEANPNVGPESVFSHPDFAHLANAGPEPNFRAAHASFTAGARENGFDPAEVHRRAGQRLHFALNALVRDSAQHMPPEKQEPLLRIRATPLSGPNIDREKNDAHVAEAKKQLDAFHARGRTAKPIDKAALMHDAYSSAHAELRTEREEKRTAADFADRYFHHDNPLRRAAKYLKDLKGDDRFTPDHLDPDTRDAIAEDLSHLPPVKLATHVAWTGEQYSPGDAATQIAHKAVGFQAARVSEQKKAPKPERLGNLTTHSHDYYAVTSDELNGDSWAGVKGAAQVVPAVGAKFLDPDKAILVRHGSLLDVALGNAGLDDIGENQLNTEQGQHALFNSLKSGFQVAQSDVPASAKDYGGTSGSKGTGEYEPEEGWNPHAVNVYRRLDDHTYMVRPGDGRSGDWYEFVPAKDVPPLSRLPEPYWSKFDPEQEPTHDSELAERTDVREAKESPEGSRDKREIQTLPTAREYTKRSQTLIGEHKRTGNLVRSDDALRDQVQALGTDYDFSNADVAEPEPEHEDDDTAPLRDRLDAHGAAGVSESLTDLHDALSDLADHDHDHDYDPDEIDPFDASHLTSADESREDTAQAKRDHEADFESWADDAKDTVRKARNGALDKAAKFRRTTGKKLRAVIAAAKEVVAAPAGSIDDDVRSEAAATQERAEKLLARAGKVVRMSLTGSDMEPDAESLWDACSGPVYTETVRL